MLKKKGQKLVAVIYLDVPDEELIVRATGRRTHRPSGRTYHVLYHPPKVPDKDDLTGEPLTQRPDDKAEVVKQRLATFHTNNESVLKYYEERKLVWHFNGKGSIDSIWKEIDAKLSSAISST